MQKVVLARDSKAANFPKSGLTPQWVHLTNADTQDRVASPPPFHELPGGHYLFSMEVEPGQLFFGQVDLGAELLDGNDRFVDVYLEHPDARRGGGVD